MTAIRIERLSKTYGNAQALRGVDLEIEPGETVAPIGASGSGKSTLIRHVSGLIRSDRRTGGTVSVHGCEVQTDGVLSREAKVLLADEPSASLDPASAKRERLQGSVILEAVITKRGCTTGMLISCPPAPSSIRNRPGRPRNGIPIDR